jgi:hypothetical protein
LLAAWRPGGLAFRTFASFAMLIRRLMGFLLIVMPGCPRVSLVLIAGLARRRLLRRGDNRGILTSGGSGVGVSRPTGHQHYAGQKEPNRITEHAKPHGQCRGRDFWAGQALIAMPSEIPVQMIAR